jgi:phosphoribosylformylglycinamidine synthase
VLRVPGTDAALAIAVDCNPRYCYLDPYEGARLAVAECARNISCTGAKPLGTTDCMNFGDPTNPEIMWQFARAIDGMSEACLALDVPVVGGNVSLYNASSNVDIYPTPTVALVGRFEQPLQESRGYCTMAFEQAGDAVLLLGTTRVADMGGSEYLWTTTGELGARPPKLDLEAEVALQDLLRELISDGVLASAHDCSEGGLGVALVESCLASKDLLGVDLEHLDVIERADLTLFSESPSRVVVSTRWDDFDTVLEAAARANVPASLIGKVTERSRVIWGEHLDLALGEAKDRHETGLDMLD